MAIRAFTIQEHPFEQILHVAIAVTRVHVPDREQYHVGVLHKETRAGQISLLHLAWHNRLHNGPPKPYYLWIPPPIPELRARQVAAVCRKVHRSNSRGIPFGFSPPNDSFDKTTGEFLLGPNRVGLTCAAF